MSEEVLTEVSAVVAKEHESALLAGFRELLGDPVPDGLLRTELLRGSDGQWRIQTLWRNRTALDAMRAGPQPPAAPELFRRVGASPALTVFEITEGRVFRT